MEQISIELKLTAMMAQAIIIAAPSENTLDQAEIAKNARQMALALIKETELEGNK
jgi:hypothetical protein